MFESPRHRWTLRKLTRGWLAYREFLDKKLGNWASSTADEQAFLELQGNLATWIARVAASVPPDGGFDAQKNFSVMYGLLNRFRSLLLSKALTEEEREEIEAQWHEAYLFLNRLAGSGVPASRPLKKERRTGETWGGVPIDRGKRWGIPAIRLLRFAIRLGILAVVLFVIGRTIGFFKPSGGHLQFHPPRTLGGAVANFVDGSREVGAAAGSVVRPMVEMYGVEVTLILAGVLVLGIAYFVFVRG